MAISTRHSRSLLICSLSIAAHLAAPLPARATALSCKRALESHVDRARFQRVFNETKVEVDADTTEPLSSQELYAATTGALLVWARHMDSPTTIRLEISDWLGDRDGNAREKIRGFYDPERDLIQLAVESVKRLRMPGVPLEARLWLASAHEATHKVQVALGDRPNFSLDHGELAAGYAGDPYEGEAWMESLDLFKAIYPASAGRIVIGNVIADLPVRSTYPGLRVAR